MKGFKATLVLMSIFQALVSAESIRVPLTRKVQQDPVTWT